MELGPAGAALDIDEWGGQVAACRPTGLGNCDPARMVAATLVGGVQERDPLRRR